MPEYRTSGVTPVSPGPQVARGPSKTKLPETNYQRWYGRFVAIFGRFGGGFKKLGYMRPKSTETIRVFESFSEAGQHSCHNDYHRSLYDYKVAAAMHLHKLASLKEITVSGHKEIILDKGSKMSSIEALDSVHNTINKSPVEICYEFLGEGRDLPTGFLNRAILPHFEELIVDTYGATIGEARLLIVSIFNETGMTSDSSVTFERLLELKNSIRWTLGTDVVVTINPATGQRHKRFANWQSPVTTRPVLDAPGKTSYQLDEEDKTYIQTSVDKGGSLKIPKHDLRNRLKRSTLRNKKNFFLNGMGVLVSTAITAVASGGPAGAINLLIYLGWFAAWSGLTESVRMVKVMRAMQTMEKTADFALNPTDMEVFKGFDEKKFRSFMKACRYVCSQETISRIYNDYAELEKDAEKSIHLSKQYVRTASDAIRFEESKARYRYRQKNLDVSFDLFNRLYTGAIGDIRRMETEWDQDIMMLWEHKFKTMSPKKRTKLFNKAANDSRVVGRSYHFKTDKIDWLKEIFPKMADGQEWSEIERQHAFEKASKAISDASTGNDLPDNEKEEFNQYTDKVANAVQLIKRGMHSYAFGWGKSALRSTLSHGFKVGWHGVRNAPFLEITPQLPKVSVDGLAIFGFFFLSDMLLDQVNTGVNNFRLRQIEQNRKGKTGINRRERTGREEIGTLRTLAKRRLPSFIDTLLSFHDAHKDIMAEMEYHKHLNKVDPYSPPFSHMDSYEAAVLILRRKYLEQVMAQKTTGAVGQFHKQIKKKSRVLATRMTDVLVR